MPGPEPQPRTIPDSPETRRDAEIVARSLHGKGAALSRLIKASGLTQIEVAERVGVNRTSVSFWCTETKWPAPQRVLKLLNSLPIDRAVLNDVGIWIQGEATARDVFRATGELTAFSVTRDELIALVKESDDFTRRDMLFKVLYPLAIMAMGLRAAGIKGAESADPRAATWLAHEYEKHQEEARRRMQEGDRAPSSMQAQWAAGNLNAHVERVQESPSVQVDPQQGDNMEPPPANRSDMDVLNEQ